MYARVMKWVTIATLLLTVLYWGAAQDFRRELDLVVCIAACMVMKQAYQAKKYSWAGGFLTIALVFNPLVPLFRPVGDIGLSIVVFSIVPFVVSLVELRPRPIMSIPSITDRNPGSRSL
jgi:hypothetical protein